MTYFSTYIYPSHQHVHGRNTKNVKSALKYYLNVNKRRHLQFKYLHMFFIQRFVRFSNVQYVTGSYISSDFENFKLCCLVSCYIRLAYRGPRYIIKSACVVSTQTVLPSEHVLYEKIAFAARQKCALYPSFLLIQREFRSP